MAIYYDEKQRKRKELKSKKDRLFELERLKFEKDESAYKLKEDLRKEIIKLEKELNDLSKT